MKIPSLSAFDQSSQMAKWSLVMIIIALVSACSDQDTTADKVDGTASQETDNVQSTGTAEHSAGSGGKSPDNSIPVIFDTDMAIDDWSTLLFLQHHASINFLALTIAGSGESHCEPGMANALALLDLALFDADAEPDVPVACGDPWPLDGYFVFPVPWQEDMDKLSGVPVPASERQPYSGHAVELIHEQIQRSSEQVVLLATGPLTNIAQWLEKYPEDSDKVSRLVIMGGAINATGNIIVPGFTDNNPNLHAEWNFYIDPVATDKVLQSDLPIELVSLDVTNQVRVTADFAARFKTETNNPSAQFWDAVLDANDWFIESGEYYFWDVLAALTVVDRETYCRGDYARLGAKQGTTDSPWLPTSDLTIPDQNWLGQPRQHLDGASAGVVEVLEGDVRPGNSLVCRETDAAKAFETFIATLTKTDQT